MLALQAGLAAERANNARITAALEAAVHRLRHADSAERRNTAELAACQQDLAAARMARVEYCATYLSRLTSEVNWPSSMGVQHRWRRHDAAFPSLCW